LGETSLRQKIVTFRGLESAHLVQLVSARWS
jgi:hypothetical protein